MTRRKFFLSFLLCALSSSAVAQDRIATALDSLPTIKKIEQVAISPDGKSVAYIVDGQLSVEPLTGGEARRIAPDQELAARDVTWSADSKKLAWLGDLPTDIPAAELWSASADGSGLVKLADLKGYASTSTLRARWSEGRSALHRRHAADRGTIAADDAASWRCGREDLRAAHRGGRCGDDEAVAGHAVGCLRLRIRLDAGLEGMGRERGARVRRQQLVARAPVRGRRRRTARCGRSTSRSGRSRSRMSLRMESR